MRPAECCDDVAVFDPCGTQAFLDARRIPRVQDRAVATRRITKDDGPASKRGHRYTALGGRRAAARYYRPAGLEKSMYMSQASRESQLPGSFLMFR